MRPQKRLREGRPSHFPDVVLADQLKHRSLVAGPGQPIQRPSWCRRDRPSAPVHQELANPETPNSEPDRVRCCRHSADLPTHRPQIWRQFGAATDLVFPRRLRRIFRKLLRVGKSLACGVIETVAWWPSVFLCLFFWVQKARHRGSLPAAGSSSAALLQWRSPHPGHRDQRALARLSKESARLRKRALYVPIASGSSHKASTCS